jgi:hypothetical protein
MQCHMTLEHKPLFLELLLHKFYVHTLGGWGGASILSAHLEESIH